MLLPELEGVSCDMLMLGPLGLETIMGDGGVERWSPSDEREIAEPTESVLFFLLTVGNFGCLMGLGLLSTFSWGVRGVPLLWGCVYLIGWAGRGELRASPGVLGRDITGVGVGARGRAAVGAGA